MDDNDNDLWGPPFVVLKDTLCKQTLRGCEFWFDYRTDVLEESYQNKRYCEKVWLILSDKKKQDDEIETLDNVGSLESDKTLSGHTSSAKSDENMSGISDAQTIETRDSDRLKPQDTTAANVTLTVNVAEDVDTSSSNELASKTEEHSCLSLVSDQIFDSIKQSSENKSLSPISRENQQRDSLRDIVTVSEPFTTESLLEMCDEPGKDREASCDERSKRSSHPEATKTVVKDELIINLLTEERHKAESTALLDDPRPVLVKKRQRESNNSEDKDMKTKQRVQGESNRDSLVDSGDERSERDGHMVIDLAISTSELKNKTGKELKTIAKALKVTHYYKLKKEDLLQRLTRQLSP